MGVGKPVGKEGRHVVGMAPMPTTATANAPPPRSLSKELLCEKGVCVCVCVG